MRRAIKRFIWKVYARWMTSTDPLTFESTTEAFMIETLFDANSLTLTEGDIYPRICPSIRLGCWITPLRPQPSLVKRSIRSIDVLLDKFIPTWALEPVQHPHHSTTLYINIHSPQKLNLIQRAIFMFLRSVSHSRLFAVTTKSSSSLDRIHMSRIFCSVFVNRLVSS
jgi:hypothetical protein